MKMNNCTVVDHHQGNQIVQFEEKKQEANKSIEIVLSEDGNKNTYRPS